MAKITILNNKAVAKTSKSKGMLFEVKRLTKDCNDIEIIFSPSAERKNDVFGICRDPRVGALVFDFAKEVVTRMTNEDYNDIINDGEHFCLCDVDNIIPKLPEILDSSIVNDFLQCIQVYSNIIALRKLIEGEETSKQDQEEDKICTLPVHIMDGLDIDITFACSLISRKQADEYAKEMQNISRQLFDAMFKKEEPAAKRNDGIDIDAINKSIDELSLKEKIQVFGEIVKLLSE